MNMKIFLAQKGQTLIELIVVIVMVVLVVTALTIATISSLRNSNFAKNQSIATKLAQEGLERVRIGRDQNSLIFHDQLSLIGVTSWNGISGTGALWDYPIKGNCGDDTASTPTYCYFNVDSTINNLTYLISGSPFPTQQAESPFLTGVQTNSFKRVVILSDDSNTYQFQKKVTVVVRWNDVSGNHESRLSTILRKI